MKTLQGCLFPALVWLASTVSADTSTKGGGVSPNHLDGSQKTGSDVVKDYTITMLHDNGYRHAELFYEKRKKEKAIVCGDDLYRLDD